MKAKFLLIFCLFCLQCRLVLAQGGSATTGSRSLFCSAPVWPDFPLIIVNNKVYSGSLLELNGRIQCLMAFKGPGASALYGVNAARGVIVVSTKKNGSKLFSPASADTCFHRGTVYVCDGALQDFNTIKTSDIIETDTIFRKKIKDSDTTVINKLIVNLSRKYLSGVIKKKLMTLSEKYAAFMNIRHTDADVIYVVNGQPLESISDEMLRLLYNIPARKIRYKGILDKHKFRQFGKSAVIFMVKA